MLLWYGTDGKPRLGMIAGSVSLIYPYEQLAVFRVASLL